MFDLKRCEEMYKLLDETPVTKRTKIPHLISSGSSSDNNEDIESLCDNFVDQNDVETRVPPLSEDSIPDDSWNIGPDLYEV